MDVWVLVSGCVSCAFSLSHFCCLFVYCVCPILVCLFLFYLIFLDACLYSNEKEKERVWIGEVQRIWEELREGKTSSEYTIRKQPICF